VRSPPDPYLRKERPRVNPEARKTETLPELLNRGHQLLLELDRIHARIHADVKDALRLEPQAWKGVRLSKGDYDKVYAELMALSKRINVILQDEHPELLQNNPEGAGSFGFAPTPRRSTTRSDPQGRGLSP
jgi:hypothetical protein